MSGMDRFDPKQRRKERRDRNRKYEEIRKMYRPRQHMGPKPREDMWNEMPSDSEVD